MNKKVFDNKGNVWKDEEGNLWKDALKFHFWYGIESKFPICCIIYFCNFFLTNNFYSWITNEDYQKIDHENKWIGYIQCPNCIANSLENLKID